LVRQLRRLGFEVSRLHARTLMLRIGIRAMTPQPGSSKPAPVHKAYPYLLRNVAVVRANQVWALDSTYIRGCRRRCWPRPPSLEGRLGANSGFSSERGHPPPWACRWPVMCADCLFVWHQALAVLAVGMEQAKVA